MWLFFLLATGFFISIQVDAGSTFRPLDSAKTRYLTPIPTQNKTLKFGDNIWITQTNPSGNATGSDKHWSVALFSSKYEALFFLSVQPIAENKGAVVFNSNNGPWFTGKWQKEERHDVGTSLNEYLWLNIKNTPEAIKIEVSDWYRGRRSAFFTFAHRTANPATDYQYLYLHKPTQSFGKFNYHELYYYNDRPLEKEIFITPSENKWQLGQPWN